MERLVVIQPGTVGAHCDDSALRSRDQVWPHRGRVIVKTLVLLTNSSPRKVTFRTGRGERIGHAAFRAYVAASAFGIRRVLIDIGHDDGQS
jgi:hypothetical protein